MSEKIQCPNCQGEAEKNGNEIICLACDAKFKVTKTGSATAVKLGEFEQLKNRVGEIEALLAPDPEPEPEPGEPEPGEPEPILPE